MTSMTADARLNKRANQLRRKLRLGGLAFIELVSALKETLLDGQEVAETLVAEVERLRKALEIKKRVGNGVCPCCNRTFENLSRHMSCKHPEYKTESKD